MPQVPVSVFPKAAARGFSNAHSFQRTKFLLPCRLVRTAVHRLRRCLCGIDKRKERSAAKLATPESAREMGCLLGGNAAFKRNSKKIRM
jgi:hypothetical protein